MEGTCRIGNMQSKDILISYDSFRPDIQTEPFLCWDHSSTQESGVNSLDFTTILAHI